MRAPTPHFLLFSDSQSPRNCMEAPHAGGRWRFVLESVDGSTQFAAEDDEQEFASERLDLLAVVRGLEALDQPSQVTLVTNSQYVRRGIRFGLEDWRANNWKWESYGEMAPVPNADLWQRVDRALGIHDVHCRSWMFEPSAQTSADVVNYPTRASAGERLGDQSVHTGIQVRGSTSARPRNAPSIYGQLVPRVRLLIRQWRRWLWAPTDQPLAPNGI